MGRGGRLLLRRARAWPTARELPLRVRSMVGLLPLSRHDDARRGDPAPAARSSPTRLRWFLASKPEYGDVVGATTHARDGRRSGGCCRIVAAGAAAPDPGARCSTRTEFLSPYGLRSLSRGHRDAPVHGRAGRRRRTASTTSRASRRRGLFGGNSNWRGPVWFPVNYLVIEALRRYADFFGDDLLVEFPTGSGRKRHPRRGRRRPVPAAGRAVPDDARRPAARVRRRASCFQRDPAWHDLLPFHEYFHGDTGAGLGASHQTGWTGLVADLILGQGRP